MNTSRQLVQPDPSRTLVLLGCHPDDIEFAAGGLAARTAEAEGRVVIIHLGLPKHDRIPDDAKCKRAARILGAEVGVFRFGDFGVSLEAVEALHEAIEPFRPARFVCLWPLDMHPTHASAGFLAFRAVLDLIGGGDTKLRESDELWFGELNPGIACRTFKPDLYCDITPVIEKKWAACGLYVGGDGTAADGIAKWGYWGENQIVVEKFRGLEAGVARAEAFAAYSGWNESPVDRPWGWPMGVGEPKTEPWWSGKLDLKGLSPDPKVVW